MRKRTSETDPLRVDLVDNAELGVPGNLGMTIAPGMKDDARGGRWERDLDADLRRLKEAYNTDVLVSLMEQEEYERFGIADLTQRTEAFGIEVLHFPITDVSTPRQSQTDEYATLVQTIIDRLARGETVVIHCRGGLGRTGTVAATVLVALGHPTDEAIGIVREARSHRAIETFEQEEYVRRFEEQLREGSPEGVVLRRKGDFAQGSLLR